MQIDDSIRQQALAHLTKARKHHSKELSIQHELTNLFDSLGAGPIVAQRVKSREADLHLTAHNVVIEVKATDNAKPSGSGSGFQETQQDQLHYYVRELRNELINRNDISGIAREPWMGILSDGQSGWVWRWGKNKSDQPVPMNELNWMPLDTDQVVFEKILDILGNPKGKQWAPAEGIYDLFKEAEASFGRLYKVKKSQRHTKTKYGLWLDSVRASGMVPKTATEKGKLFVKHTFLVSVAKAVIDALNADHKHSEIDVVDKLSEGFTGWVVEDKEGRDICSDLFEKARVYDWIMPFGDVLRQLYQDCIPKPDRKVYGEYYTPDWLAEQLAEQVLDEHWIEDSSRKALSYIQGEPESLNGVGILDPTCGSGTFLYHAALRIGKSATLRDAPAETRGKVISRLVHGIDIHPVAVEMSKATLLRAISRSGKVDEHELDVVLGDSLIVDRDYDLLDQEIIIRSPAGSSFKIPDDALDHPGFRHAIPQLVEAARDNRPIPKTIDDDLKKLLSDAHKGLKSIIQKEGDTVWSHHILNLLGPSRLTKTKVDRILANPPWVRASNIQEEQRKDEIEAMARRMEIWPGGKHSTGFDIAALFVMRCRDLYLAGTGNKASWIVNSAAIRAGNWERFRNRRHVNHGTEIYDYQKLNEQPFTGARCCAILESDQNVMVGQNKRLTQWINHGEGKVRRDDPWHVAKKKINPIDVAQSIKTGDSDYLRSFTQGTTLVPHCLVVIDKYKAKGGGYHRYNPQIQAIKLGSSRANNGIHSHDLET